MKMALKDIIDRIKGITKEEPDTEERPPLRDKYLESLRRERQKQLEVLEKRRLIQEIRHFKKEESRKNLWGYGRKYDMSASILKNLPETKMQLLKEKFRVLQEHKVFGQKSLLNNHIEEFKRRKRKNRL
jgi:uncharacterized protein YnzC (UPF0291/DUF896 family)